MLAADKLPACTVGGVQAGGVLVATLPVKGLVGVEHPPQIVNGEDELRGLGAPAEKSVLLLSVSVQPLLTRRAAVVLVRAAVGALPSAQVEPLPKATKSTAAFAAGQPLNKL